MKIIQGSQHHEEVYFERAFWYVGHRNWGYSFKCDEKGVVDTSKLNPGQLASYESCLTGTINGSPVYDAGVQRHVNYWVEPMVGLCRCGESVYLDNFTNTCACGRDYSMSGQLLAPREQWGEETGEHWSDIIGC